MIKQSREGIELEGTVPQIMTDLTVIVRNVNKAFIECGMSEEEAKDNLQHSFDLGFKPYEELKKDAVEKLQEMIGDEPNVVLDFIKAMLGIDYEESKDESDADHKVWCKTNKIRDEVLKKLDSDGIRWVDGKKPLEFKPHSPIGLHIFNNAITFSNEREVFDDDDSKEVKAEELIKECKCNE